MRYFRVWETFVVGFFQRKIPTTNFLPRVFHFHSNFVGLCSIVSRVGIKPAKGSYITYVMISFEKYISTRFSFNIRCLSVDCKGIISFNCCLDRIYNHKIKII